jgi:hypothetical protein
MMILSAVRFVVFDAAILGEFLTQRGKVVHPQRQPGSRNRRVTDLPTPDKKVLLFFKSNI